MANFQTVLFDLDGTILDTNELIIQSFLHALKDVVPEGFAREHIIPSMGLPLAVQLQQFSGAEDVAELIGAYRAINLQLHDDLVKPFPYVPEVLDQLHKAGLALGVVTTKMQLTTERGLKHVGIRDYMQAIVTLDDVERPKPDAQPVELALSKLGAAADTALMVGDSVVDIQSAAAAGVRSVGVAWSLKGEAKLREAGADYIIHDMRELLSLAGLEQETP
ncbi:pyrophosphatase PpaX [Paenibacillus sp. 1P07SE]|uniref:pyrophosphatase PpaX n=1 Tax=Paenibacillus sp. 1P07SE TaxID=3132209 RepID=UPI0039A6A434